ncbi:MAG TPA: malto-oligosyltrehalose trehalohydrolase [Casimicrobiaceae bacterium]|nr:malto-oligosyltrehalose trehalohydrolase [Casimicrobiaceae bacterium]
MKRAHRMPFGAEATEDGRTRFRLWAPRANAVDIALERDGAKRTHAMRATDGGLFEAVVDDAPAGTRYAFRIDGRDAVPDPASRWNPEDVHGPSVVVDPGEYSWQDGAWHGRAWHQAVIYELHVGTFTPEGTFTAAIDRLGHVKSLGVTAIELMPVADFAGARNWGYDGVLLYAPDASYGTPSDLKRLVDAAHAHDLMVLLDVVYNHFGPEGNYLPEIAPEFFNAAHQTPWGPAINYDGECNRAVRDFVIHNALYWLEEYHFDGLRLDAVHAIVDTSPRHIVMELADTVRKAMPSDRHVHLVLENDGNTARYLTRATDGTPLHATAQWNDDAHHALHVILTGETDAYYADYARRPARYLARCLAEGYAYQGEWSSFRGRTRGEPSAALPLDAFVNFLQNHDQVGNRAFGERIDAFAPTNALRAAVACLLLSPSPPMLFMGEEFAASSPFLFFCDFEGELADAVRRGRRAEFARFPAFSDPSVRERIPDPNARETFERCRLRWQECNEPGHRDWLELYRRCLAIRRDRLVPLLGRPIERSGRYHVREDDAFTVTWQLESGMRWQLDANLSDRAVDIGAAQGEVVFACGIDVPQTREPEKLPAWGVRVSLRRA